MKINSDFYSINTNLLVLFVVLPVMCLFCGSEFMLMVDETGPPSVPDPSCSQALARRLCPGPDKVVLPLFKPPTIPFWSNMVVPVSSPGN